MSPPIVQLLKVRDAEAELASASAVKRRWPVDAKPAELRILPFPFSTYAGLSNDCDSGKFTFQEIEAFFGFVREGLNLPIGDSYFPDLLCTGIIPYQPTTKAENVAGVLSDPDSPEFRRRMANYARKFHLGWFDTIHGFLTSLAIKLPYTDDEKRSVETGDAAELPPGSGYLARRRTLAVGRNGYKACERFKFYAPAGWEQQRPPRYVVLNYQAPLLGTTVHLRIFVGEELVISTAGLTGSSVTPLSAPNDYVIDLWPQIGFVPNRLHAIEVEVEVSGPDGAFIELNDVFLISRLRSDMQRYRRAMERYNMTSTVFTSHGIGLVFAPQFGLEGSATDPRRLADLPANRHYAVDILSDHGVRFFNTYSNTCSMEPFHIDDLTFPNLLSDGRVVYDFRRYAYAPKDANGASDLTFWKRGGKAINQSLVDALGTQIFGLLSETANNNGNGGLIYTHAYATNKPDETQPPELYIRPFNDYTRQALETLAERFYNMSGATPEEARVFVASLPVLLRYSVVRKGLLDRAFYREKTNSVHIEPWFDPILRESIPSTPESRELRGITAYVRESHTARVFIGETEFRELIRNPRDTTGRESVTLADVGTPLIIVGRVPLSLTRAEINLMGATVTHGELGETTPAKQGVELTLADARATMVVAPPAISVANYQALRLVFRKSDRHMRFGISIEFEHGLRTGFAEARLAVSRDRDLVTVPAWETTDERVLIVPFYTLIEGRGIRQAGERQPGFGRIIRWTLTVEGAPGATFNLSAYQFLRDCDQSGWHDGLIVAGFVPKVLPPIERVRMRYDEMEFETEPTIDGVYAFDRKVPRNSIIEIYGLAEGREIDPANGRFYHIVTNKTDIDF